MLWTPLFFGGSFTLIDACSRLAKQKEVALANIVALTGTVVAMTVKMHGLRTPFSTTWFLAPYCAWLGYGKSGFETVTDD